MTALWNLVTDALKQTDPDAVCKPVSPDLSRIGLMKLSKR